MSVKYWYLDDEVQSMTETIVESLNEEVDELTVELKSPKSFGEQVDEIKKAKIDGLLLDLRLDEKSDAEYRALSLAQELRTRATEGGSNKDIPIVVCSTDAKLKKSYNKDGTGHDLFDRKYIKDDFVYEAEIVAKELVSLAKGYKTIATTKSSARGAGAQIKQFLGLDVELTKGLDVRFLDYFGEMDGRPPVHEYARFILNDLVLTSGPLIGKSLLAARLGIDISSSSDFDELLGNKLNSTNYSGPFSDCWERWWWHLVEGWWNSKVKEPMALMTAEDRVDALKKATKLENLVAAQPIEGVSGNQFWTICEFYNAPLDLLDAVVIQQKEPLAWQNTRYISVPAALDPASKAKDFYPHQLEKERVAHLKKASSDE